MEDQINKAEYHDCPQTCSPQWPSDIQKKINEVMIQNKYIHRYLSQ